MAAVVPDSDASMDTSEGPSAPKTTQSTQGGVFHVLRTLGEGAFGEVKLVVDRGMQCAVAMKCMDLRRDPNTVAAFRKEALLQRMLSQGAGHDNIIRYIGMRVDERKEEFQIMLEYADGGELFDQIEPDVGMGRGKAQHYFRQLLDGLDFMHGKGIAHRDIKPENLLLTQADTLKISDFGMATIFRHNEKERVLDAQCGTMPYASPQVLVRRYRGPPADLWSCGVVLVALLAGELPWNEARPADAGFHGWIESTSLQQRPWCKIDNQALSLLRAILTDNEAARATSERIRAHPWFRDDSTTLAPTERRKLAEIQDESLSQPLSRVHVYPDGSCGGGGGRKYSQPEHMDDLYLSSSQFDYSQNSNADPLERLSRRLTRFCVGVPASALLARLSSACSSLGYSLTPRTDGALVSGHSWSCMLFVHHMHHRVMVDFRRSSGDGLEFKRAFVLLRSLLADVICPQATLWLEQQGLTSSQP